MAEATPRLRKKRLGVVVLIVLASLLTLGAGGLGAWGLFFGFERPLRPGDSEVFVTFDRLAEQVPGLTKTPRSETFHRKRFLDGSFEVAYEYEDENLSIDSSANHERSTRDAKALFTGVRLAIPATVKVATDVELVPRNDLYSGGDDHYCAAMMSDGFAGGHALVVLDGKDVFTLMIGGAFVDSPAEFRALVQPRLDALKRLR